MHLAYIWIVSHLCAKNYRNWWKFDEVLTKTNLLSFFGTRCITLLTQLLYTRQIICLQWTMSEPSNLEVHNTTSHILHSDTSKLLEDDVRM